MCNRISRRYLDNLVSEIRQEILDINNGGCSTFALILAEQLTVLNIEHKIILIDNNKVYRLKHTDSCHHVLIKIGRYYIDGYNVSLTKRDWGRKISLFEREIDKILPKFKFGNRKLRYFWGYSTLDRLRIMVEKGWWCDDYKKSQNEYIENIVKKHIYDYQNEI